mgnify:CR=1 FL=1
MIISGSAVLVGILLLVWSANRFVDGSSRLAQHLGMSPLLIGMVIIGFGTSSPELIVSVQAAVSGVPALALGNAYGSNITNIALILGLTSMIAPISVQSRILKKELPILVGVTAISALLISDGVISRVESIVLLVLFLVLMGWTFIQGRSNKQDALGDDVTQDLSHRVGSLKRAIASLVVGLAFLIASSRMLIWGAVQIAQQLGLSDLVIGLTIVAIGTSLPELASAIAATRKGEHDLALGNVLGSNLFNTLAVVGIAGVIHPMDVGREVFTRDMVIMGLLTVSLFIIGYKFPKGKGRINRFEGLFLVLCYCGYLALLLFF